MFLKKIEMERFRPYEDATLTLPEKGLIFLAGPNNSGKSALLAAFDVAAGRSGQGIWRHSNANMPARVVATFHLSDEDRKQVIVRASPKNSEYQDHWLATHAFAMIEITFVETPDNQMIAESVSVSDHRGDIRTIAEINYDDGGNHGSRVVRIEQILGHAPGFVDFNIEQLGWSAIAGTPNVDHAIRSHRQIHALWSEWATSLYHFNGVRTGTSRATVVSDATPTLQPTGANLAECLLYQMSQHAPGWRAIQAVMTDVLPDVGELVTPVKGPQVEVAVIDPFSKVRRNIKDLGAGVEQVLMTAYVGATQPAGSMVIIEEPETNLHAAAERELLRHLIEWAQDRPIILSTHSTVFLDQAAVANADTWVVEREAGQSVVQKADTDFGSVLRALGVRLSDVLSADKLVLVEGDTDAEILQAWFPQLVLTRQTAVVPLGGGDRAFQVEMIENAFRAGDELGRDIIFLRDADHLSSVNREKLELLERVKMLSRREIENYLLDPSAILAVLGERESYPGSEVKRNFDEEELARFIVETADALRGVVVLKSVADQLVPIRLVEKDTINMIAERSGGLPELTDAVGNALPDAKKTLTELEETWNQVEEEVARNWDADKLNLAPGTEILAAIWQAHGGCYDKRRDGPRIASAMDSGPEEVRHALAVFLKDEPN